jgi:hypothetical protein
MCTRILCDGAPSGQRRFRSRSVGRPWSEKEGEWRTRVASLSSARRRGPQRSPFHQSQVIYTSYTHASYRLRHSTFRSVCVGARREASHLTYQTAQLHRRCCVLRGHVPQIKPGTCRGRPPLSLEHPCPRCRALLPVYATLVSLSPDRTAPLLRTRRISLITLRTSHLLPVSSMRRLPTS